MNQEYCPICYIELGVQFNNGFLTMSCGHIVCVKCMINNHNYNYGRLQCCLCRHIEITDGLSFSVYRHSPPNIEFNAFDLMTSIDEDNYINNLENEATYLNENVDIYNGVNSTVLESQARINYRRQARGWERIVVAKCTACNRQKDANEFSKTQLRFVAMKKKYHVCRDCNRRRRYHLLG